MIEELRKEADWLASGDVSRDSLWLAQRLNLSAELMRDACRRLEAAQRMAQALEKIANETAATWVSDVARAALAEWEALK